MAQRQHPRDAAVVKMRFDRDEDADDDDQQPAGDCAERRSDRAGQPPERPRNLCAQVEAFPFGQEAEIAGPAHCSFDLRGDDHAQRLGLRADGRPGEPEGPAEEGDREQDDERQADAAADRQDAPEQARTSVEQDRKDHPADNQHQRLGQGDDPDDEQRQAEPDGRASQLATRVGIAEFGRAGLLDIGLVGRRLGHLR